jgi:hypothetical protein
MLPGPATCKAWVDACECCRGRLHVLHGQLHSKRWGQLHLFAGAQPSMLLRVVLVGRWAALVKEEEGEVGSIRWQLGHSVAWCVGV